MSRQSDRDRAKVFTRRAVLLGGVQVAMASALVGRMYYLQVVQADRYATLAEENRINMRLLAPPRGTITDRFGVPMAVNRQDYRVILVAERARDVDETLAKLAQIIALSPDEQRKALREVGRRRSFVPVLVREGLNWSEVSRVEVNAPDLPGVSIEEGLSRFYPQGAAAAHLMGYTGAVSEQELVNNTDPLLELPDFRIGKSGIEKAHDAALRGKAGASQVEINAGGRVIRELSRNEPTPGVQLELTLDIGLQTYVAERLSAESAAGVVMDIHTGEVLALASVPAYDPNDFTGGITTALWKDLTQNPRTPLINKAIAGQYAPGSTYKLAVALAGLETGAITHRHTVFCGGSTSLGNATFHCWKKGGHGRVDLRYAIKQSCDVYFYDVAMRIGIDRLAEMSRRLGLGQETGIDLPNERPGVMPDIAWKRKTLNQPWHKGETLIAGIGQGYVLATPLQLALMTARIANGGIAVKPRLTRNAPVPGQKQANARAELASIGFSKQNLDIVMDGMYAVVNEPGGTALSSRLEDPAVQMGGKTGTSQVRRITMSERAGGVKKNEDLPWEQRDHALFVCVAPMAAPQYAVSVIVEHGGGGSAVAAPVARDIMAETLRRDPSRAGPVAQADTTRKS